MARRNAEVDQLPEDVERVLREDEARVAELRPAIAWVGTRGGVYPCAVEVLQAAGSAKPAAVIAALTWLGAPIGTRGLLSQALFDLGESEKAATAAWARLSGALRPRLSPQAWATWLRPCRGLWLREGRLQLEVPGAQHLDWIGRTWSAELQWAAAESGLEGVDLVMAPARAAGE